MGGERDEIEEKIRGLDRKIKDILPTLSVAKAAYELVCREFSKLEFKRFQLQLRKKRTTKVPYGHSGRKKKEKDPLAEAIKEYKKLDVETKEKLLVDLLACEEEDAKEGRESPPNQDGLQRIPN